MRRDSAHPESGGLPLRALGLLALAAGLIRLLVVAPRPHPPGTDGYYYVVQAEDLALLGSLHVPDASWVLRWLSLPAMAGLDPAWSVAFSASALIAATVWISGWLGRSLGGAPAGWLLAGFAAASPTLTHLCADFPKNLGAVPLGLAALALAAGPGARAPRLGLALLLALGAATAHRSGAVLVGLGAVGLLLGQLSSRARLPGRAAWALGAGLGALLLFAGLASWLPGLLHPQDLERVWSQLRPSPWPLPPWSWLPHRRTDLAQLLELAAVPWAALLGGGLAWLRCPEDRPWLSALLLPLAVAMFPWWRADGLDLGYRLGLLAPLLGAPVLAVLLARRLRAPERWLPAWPLLLLGLPLGLSGYDPGSAPPFASYERFLRAIPEPLPELLIVEPGASFYYDHLTGREALAWAPEPGLDRRGIYRVVWGVRDGEWARYVPEHAEVRPVRLDREHVYVREDVWETFVQAARAEGDEELLERIFDRRNPSVVRPASLLRNR